MQLRLDALLADLRQREEEILATIDADPLLLKRMSGQLVLANASQKLYTPSEQHQLYAKGIVYRRSPYRLVSLPLIKIYNVGERDMTATELSSISAEPGTLLRFLRKLDGSLIQAFWADGRVWFTTRGMIEGATGRGDEGEERGEQFDYLGAARQIAQTQYPALVNGDALRGRTLLFELLHPDATIITNYGGRTDLVLHACFDHARYQYLDYPALVHHAAEHRLSVVDALTPAGGTLGEQIESILAQFEGTDEEGSVVCFERDHHVTYRVKVKTPEYFRLMRLMAFCTYARTVELIDASGAQTWDQLSAILQEQGNERVPEEVLGYYREHWDRWQQYLADLGRIAQWAESQRAAVDAAIGGMGTAGPAEYRKRYALEAKGRPHSALLFAALDGRLDVRRLRQMVSSPDEAREMIASFGP